MTTGYLVRNLWGNSHLEGNGNWNIKLKYVLRIIVCKVKCLLRNANVSDNVPVITRVNQSLSESSSL